MSAVFAETLRSVQHLEPDDVFFVMGSPLRSLEINVSFPCFIHSNTEKNVQNHVTVLSYLIGGDLATVALSYAALVFTLVKIQ